MKMIRATYSLIFLTSFVFGDIMREQKVYEVNLEKVTDENLDFIKSFRVKSREVIGHLLKTPHGMLKLYYTAPVMEPDREYKLIEAKFTPI